VMLLFADLPPIGLWIDGNHLMDALQLVIIPTTPRPGFEAAIHM
jgi:hypothetical protein